MIEEIRRLISRYVRKGIFIDTNILLLYLIGSYDPNLISRFKRTVQFTTEDYDTLMLLLHPFERFITTPNVLTEVSNFSGHIGEPIRTLYFQTFAEKIAMMEEQYIASSEAAAREEFIKVGLTDAGIFKLPQDQYLILTDDFRLSHYLQKKGIDVINFNHVNPFFL